MKRRYSILFISSEICSALLILLFMYAALSKLVDFERFYFQLQRSPLFSELAKGIAVMVPIIEIICAILLTIRSLRLFGFFASYLLMALFSAYVYAILHYSPEIPCSCGGVLEMMNWDQHFIFNLLFTLIALAGIITQTRLKSLLQ